MTKTPSNPMSEPRPDASATSDTHPTPPALTAAQMADIKDALKAGPFFTYKGAMTHVDASSLDALLSAYTTAQARIEALEGERDELQRWVDEAVKSCAARGCATRDARSAEAEASLTAARTRLDAVMALLPASVHEQAQDTEYLVSYIETWRDDATEFATLAGQMEAERDAARTRAEGLEAAIRELVTLVRGECPSLLDEDSGGDGRLSLAIDALLTPPPATTGDEA